MSYATVRRLPTFLLNFWWLGGEYIAQYFRENVTQPRKKVSIQLAFYFDFINNF